MPLQSQEELRSIGIQAARRAHAEHAELLRRVREHHPLGEEEIPLPRTLGDATSKWEGTVASASLLGFLDGLRAVASQAAAEGATSDETAVTIAPGLTAYALVPERGEVSGFVLQAGDETFATSFRLPSKADTGGVEPVEAVTVCRLGAPGEDDEDTLEAMRSGEGIHWFHEGMVASVRLFDHELDSRTMLSTQDNIGMHWWPRYAEAVRPLAMKVPCRIWPKGPHRIGDDYGAHEVLEADGGFRGEACDARTEEMARLITSDALRWATPLVASTATTLLERGYAWPNSLLEYADVDRFAFAVSSPDGRTVGVWHRNIDLFVGRNEHMTVLTLDGFGVPQTIAVHPTWRAPDMDDDEEDAESELLPSEHSTPMRPSRGMLARRIAAGEAASAPCPRHGSGVWQAAAGRGTL